MPDFNRPPPIHPVACTCPRCAPRLIRRHSRPTLEAALIGLIVAGAFVFAALAILGAK